ncbi:MAG: Flp family type IVb pilin [Nocardioides sp.]|uniref:Flp family type IVb pilin n=1 Tax=Nocardioides nematodiphilus TaxID=2849669 RepID=UPI001CDA3562|nr:Flp family type IVb pilin [Nocardioides nematodiphilus]MCA1983957.1 Flp family type IVb pilin [Nocardioides nematodiphilus]
MTRTSRRTDRAASAVEYALLAAGVAALIALVVFTFGGKVSNMFHNTCNTVAAQTSQAAC